MTLPGRSACVLIAAVLLAACAPTDDRVILDNLKTQLASQYHECVPLGWSPVAVAGTYYPGVTVTYSEFGTGVWFAARWIGRVRDRDLIRPDVRAIYGVLNELVRAGMLDREPIGRFGFRYNLTSASAPFFYDDSAYGNNPDHIPYLCYSTIVPQRVVWKSPISPERAPDGKHDVDGFEAQFEWSPSPVPAWANNAFVRSHSVVLGPTENPVVARFANLSGAWTVTELSATSTPAARVVDVGVWPQPRL